MQRSTDWKLRFTVALAVFNVVMICYVIREAIKLL